jgi:hypothetical protein
VTNLARTICQFINTFAHVHLKFTVVFCRVCHVDVLIVVVRPQQLDARCGLAARTARAVAHLALHALPRGVEFGARKPLNAILSTLLIARVF